MKNSPALYYPSLNYYKEQFDGIGKQKQYNPNVSCETEKAKYFTSLRYFNQKGILTHTTYGGSNTNTYYKRYNFRSNFDLDVIKNLHMSLIVPVSLQLPLIRVLTIAETILAAVIKMLFKTYWKAAFLQARVRMRIFIIM